MPGFAKLFLLKNHEKKLIAKNIVKIVDMYCVHSCGLLSITFWRGRGEEERD
jgi:hypothetical protein